MKKKFLHSNKTKQENINRTNREIPKGENILISYASEKETDVSNLQRITEIKHQGNKVANQQMDKLIRHFSK